MGGIRRSHKGPLSDCEGSRFKPWHVVHTKDRFAGKRIEQTFIHHPFSTMPALFGGLKDEKHCAVKTGVSGQMFRGAEQHRGVPIVTTRVHFSIVERAVLKMIEFLQVERV
jgi:hypothetical protein